MKSKAVQFKPAMTVALLSFALCASLVAAEDVEEKVSLDRIPAAAAKTLQGQAGGEKITGLSKEKDEGRTVFEATFKKNGHVHDVTVDEAGKLVSDEMTIALSEAPEVIRQAIEREHPGGKVDKLEHISERGKTNYEALISSKGKREEIKFDSTGKVIERENKTGTKGND
jgi:uncharacterized membrane protein YkoI